jgi:flagellar motility protein MotE (MotC chaperone)
MNKILQSGWLTALLGSIVYCGTTAAVMMSAHIPVAHPESHDAPIGFNASWDFHNPEMDLLITELKKEKDGLAVKEKQLKDLAARLEAERAELTVVTQAVHRMQVEYDRNFVRVKEEETANLRKLAKMYSGMSVEGAVLILKQMEDEQIVKILLFMKESESAPLLESFAKLGDPEAKRAAAISGQLRTASKGSPSKSS